MKSAGMAEWYLPATPARQACLACVAGGDMQDHMFYTYVLKSKRDGDFYIGFSGDLKRRIEKHDNGLVSATKDRRPLELVYYEACLDKELAIKREKYFKTGFGRRYLKGRIK
jgi:putative endonuclease